MDNSVTIIFVVLGLSAIVGFWLLRRESRLDRASAMARTKLSKEDKAILRANAMNYVLPVPNDAVPTEKDEGFGLQDVAWQSTETILEVRRPQPKEINRLDKGSMVELVATRNNGNMSAPVVVRLRDLLENDYFTGELQEDSDSELGLKEGQSVTFHSNHIRAILP
jgi:hypothetical protein